MAAKQLATTNVPSAIVVRDNVVKVPRSARHNNAARMAYSVMCPSFRNTRWMTARVWPDMEGSNHNRKGMRKREVCVADNMSDDPAKISSIQSMTGIQRVTKVRSLLFKVTEL